jgi:galactoside O-acetyltransferase
VSVGENSVIGACSLVNQNIPDNVLAIGVPARIVKKLDT